MLGDEHVCVILRVVLICKLTAVWTINCMRNIPTMNWFAIRVYNRTWLINCERVYLFSIPSKPRWVHTLTKAWGSRGVGNGIERLIRYSIDTMTRLPHHYPRLWRIPIATSSLVVRKTWNTTTGKRGTPPQENVEHHHSKIDKRPSRATYYKWTYYYAFPLCELAQLVCWSFCYMPCRSLGTWSLHWRSGSLWTRIVAFPLYYCDT